MLSGVWRQAGYFANVLDELCFEKHNQEERFNVNGDLDGANTRGTKTLVDWASRKFRVTRLETGKDGFPS